MGSSQRVIAVIARDRRDREEKASILSTQTYWCSSLQFASRLSR